MKKIILAASFSLLLILLTGCEQETSQMFAPSGTPGVIKTGCYNIEPNVSFSYGGNIYVRLFYHATIPPGKIDVSATYTGQNTPSGDKIYSFVGGNWEGMPMGDFLLVKLSDPDGYYDVYVKKTVADNPDSLPDFVKNCQPKGGNTVVMIPPPGSPQQEMPNSFFATADIKTVGFETDFNLVKDQLKNYYVKIGPTQKSNDAIQIGKIEMRTPSETKEYAVYFHLEIVYLVSGSDSYQYDGTNDFPQVQSEPARTLKLDTIRFVTLSDWNWYTPECKPVIYFYPEKDTQLSLWVFPRGYLTLTEPEYKDGWENLWLSKTGKIFANGRFYPYLHYEAMIGGFVPPPTGFVVERQNLASFFDKVLPRMGLNLKEAGDFKEYWLGRLTGFPYFQVSPLDLRQIEEIEPVKFSADPDTFIRTRFYFKGLTQPIKLATPKIEPPPRRDGFTVVEWGGLYQEEKIRDRR
jgi:hypothetical protein